jgi:hypothetical protein
MPLITELRWPEANGRFDFRWTGRRHWWGLNRINFGRTLRVNLEFDSARFLEER